VGTALGKEELMSIVDSVFELDEVVASHRRMESGDAQGRVVLSLREEW
jgi:NADPH:quinone reductase-like Zn-dependent oxidoreductase